MSFLNSSKSGDQGEDNMAERWEAGWWSSLCWVLGRGEQNQSRGQTGGPLPHPGLAVNFLATALGQGKGRASGWVIAGVSLNLLGFLHPSLQKRGKDTGLGGAWVPLTTGKQDLFSGGKISKDRKRDGRSMGFGANFRNHLGSKSVEGSVGQTHSLV